MGETREGTHEHLAVFGASGAIGEAIVASAAARGWQVTAFARRRPSSALPEVRTLALDPLAAGFTGAQMEPPLPYTCVCWAQGANLSDSVYDFDLAAHRATYDANCAYILVTLKALLTGGFLAPRARLCVLSSIWQRLARPCKLSYSMSKAALEGLVLCAAADLAAEGHLINAVLPGPVDTPMTRAHLDRAQLDRFAQATGHRRLASLGDVASLVCYLCSPENTGITGQFIAADLGYSHVRAV